MSSETWPSTLRILPDDFNRAPFFDTTVQRARDGSELRLDWGGTGIRWEFTVRTVGSERATLENFFLARKGRWDSFLFTCPEVSAQRAVRFDHDSLSGRKIGPDVYEFRISLVTVGA